MIFNLFSLGCSGTEFAITEATKWLIGSASNHDESGVCVNQSEILTGETLVLGENLP
jgi:hypothetical protein